MKRFMTLVTAGMRWTWQHASVSIAMVLIVAAFALGFWARGGGGSPAPTTQPAGEHVQGEGGEPQMYTCSMHPQVRLPDEGQHLLCDHFKTGGLFHIFVGNAGNPAHPGRNRHAWIDSGVKEFAGTVQAAPDQSDLHNPVLLHPGAGGLQIQDNQGAFQF